MDKRRAILDSALKLIDEYGIHNAPMSNIAKEAKVAAGSLYNYFENKQALIDGLYTDIKQNMSSYFKSSIDNSQSLEDKIYMCFKSLFDFYMENPVQGKFLVQYAFSTCISQELVDRNYEMFDEYTHLLQHTIDKGIIKDVPISSILCVVVGTIKETHYQVVNNSLVIDQNTHKQIYSIIIDGLKA